MLVLAVSYPIPGPYTLTDNLVCQFHNNSADHNDRRLRKF